MRLATIVTVLAIACANCFGNAGTITLSPTPSFNWGNTLLGYGSSHGFTIKNTGSVNVNVTALNITGTNASQFTVSGITLPKNNLPSQQSVSFTIIFTPSALQSYSASISVTSTATNTPSTALSGMGFQHSVTLTFNPSTTTNVVSYNIYRITSSSPTAPPTPYPALGSGWEAVAICNGLICTVSDTTVSSGTSYWYYASAVDSNDNESAPSNTAQAIISTP